MPLFGSALNPRRTDAGTYLCVRLISRGYICQSDFPILEFSSRGCIKLIGRHEQLGKGKENDWSSKSKVAKLSSGCWESDSLPVLPLLPWLRGVTLVFHAGLHVYCVCSPNLWVGFGSPGGCPPDLWCGDGVRSHLVWKKHPEIEHFPSGVGVDKTVKVFIFQKQKWRINNQNKCPLI